MNKSFSICHKTFGNPSNPCIILIMGISGQLIHWPDKFTQGLVRKGFYVVTFDNRDAGLSQYYDPVFPLEHGKELAKCLSNNHLEIIAKMGHGLPECLCDKVVDLIAKHINIICYGE